MLIYFLFVFALLVIIAYLMRRYYVDVLNAKMDYAATDLAAQMLMDELGFDECDEEWKVLKAECENIIRQGLQARTFKLRGMASVIQQVKQASLENTAAASIEALIEKHH